MNSNMKPIDKTYIEPNFDTVLEKVEDDEFSIGQSYEEGPALKLRCKLCHGSHFIVGVESYYTAIKCVNCKLELCIHSG